ncbi:MAG: hypothetical protein M3015_06695, partial [Bacteroidota bacterium]|nr:hypothetical protein [Bacteroidota bacterium]
YESLARSYAYDDEKEKSQAMIYNYFKEYPQLIPFSGFKMKMYLNTPDVENAATKKVINELKSCDINWVNEPDNMTARVYLSFSAIKNKYSVDYSVVDAGGKTIVAPQKMYFKKLDGVGKELGMRIFGVGGAVEME